VFWRIGAAALAAGVVCAALRFALLGSSALVVLIVGAVTYGAVYAAAIMVAGVLDASEWSLVRRLLRRERMAVRTNVAC